MFSGRVLTSLREPGDAPPRFLTFVHRSPFATWNSLQAWIRESGKLPQEVVLAHVVRVQEHARTVAEGTEILLDHYDTPDAETRVRRAPVAKNDLPAWRDSLEQVLQAPGPWVVDLTASRTMPKLALVDLVRVRPDAELFYLDVAEYRYEAKPFPWVPYTLQRLWHFDGAGADRSRRAGERGLTPSPGARSVANAPGLVRVDAGGRRETVIQWQALVVLLNEAAADSLSGRSGRHPSFQVKLPAFGVTVADYDLVSRRFRLHPFAEILKGLEEAAARLDPVWQAQVPRGHLVLESLAAARLLPYSHQDRLLDELHAMAAGTRGPNPGVAPRALALDTNLFYFDFVTSLARAAGLPTIRVPVVASSISRAEIRNQMTKEFPAGRIPQVLEDAQMHRPLMSRLAHAAHEEFELLRTRCRMEVITRQAATTSAQENDLRILQDFAAHRDREQQELLVVSNDRELVARAQQEMGGLDVHHVDFSDPDRMTRKTADVDELAYLIYRLALAFGRVSLKGLNVEVFGDHSEEQGERFLHEQVRLQVPDTTWVASFLHELRLRGRLDQVVQRARLWLP